LCICTRACRRARSWCRRPPVAPSAAQSRCRSRRPRRATRVRKRWPFAFERVWTLPLGGRPARAAHQSMFVNGRTGSDWNRVRTVVGRFRHVATVHGVVVSEQRRRRAHNKHRARARAARGLSRRMAATRAGGCGGCGDCAQGDGRRCVGGTRLVLDQRSRNGGAAGGARVSVQFRHTAQPGTWPSAQQAPARSGCGCVRLKTEVATNDGAASSGSATPGWTNNNITIELVARSENESTERSAYVFFNCIVVAIAGA